MNSPLDKNFISTREASELSGYNSDYISRLCREAKIECTRVGRSWYISRDSLEAFIKSQDEKRKKQAAGLSRKLEQEYRSLQIDARTTLGEQERRVQNSIQLTDLQKRGVALLVALLVMLVGVTGVSASFVSQPLQGAYALALTASTGMHEIAHDIYAQAAAHTEKEIAASNATRVFGGVYMQPQKISTAAFVAAYTAHIQNAPVAAVLPATHSASVATIVPSTHEPVLSFIQPLGAALEHPQQLPAAAVATAELTYARAGVGIYNAIIASMQWEVAGIQTAGDGVLALGTRIRDAGVAAPLAVARTELQIASRVAHGSQLLSTAILDAYSKGVYAYVNGAPSVAAGTVRTTYTVGALAANATTYLPNVISKAYLQGAHTAGRLAATNIVNSQRISADQLAAVLTITKQASSLSVGDQFALFAYTTVQNAVSGVQDLLKFNFHKPTIYALKSATTTPAVSIPNSVESQSIPIQIPANLAVTAPAATAPHTSIGNTHTTSISAPIYISEAGVSQDYVTNYVSSYVNAQVAALRTLIEGQAEAIVTSNRGGNTTQIVQTSGGGGSPSGNITGTSLAITGSSSLQDVTFANATGTNLDLSSLSIGSLNGFLKATNGAIATALVDLSSDVTGTLPVANGGTGSSSFATNGVLYGNGTNNLLSTSQGGTDTVLVANNGAPAFSSAITVGTSVTSPIINATGSLELNGVDINTSGTLSNVAYLGRDNVFTGNNSFVNATSTSFYTSLLGLGGNYFSSFLGTGLTNNAGALTVSLSPFTTDDLAEGTANLYYTDARARSALSSTAVGLAYSTTTGAFSLDSGYVIPLTASTTDWNTAFINRITTAVAPLSIANNQISIATSSLFTGTTGQTAYFDGTNSPVGTSTLFIANNGNIGIGTTTPGTTLDVAGTVRIGSTLTLSSISSCTGSQALQVDGSGDVSCGTIATGGASSGGGWTTVGGATNGAITESTTTYLVAVGATTTPYAKFSVVSGSAATTTLALVPASGQTANILDIYNTSGALSSVFTAGGLLGIGTTTPAGNLDIYGNAGLRVTSNGNSSNSSLEALFTNQDNASNAASRIGFASGNTTENLSIGYNSGNNTGTLLGITQGAYAFIKTGTNANGIILSANGANPIVLGNNNTERLRIAGNGNIGIGSSSPSSLLTVGGSTYLGGDLTATGTVAFTGITNGLLSADASGNITASTSIGVNYLTGTLGIAHGGTGTSSGGVTNGIEYYNGSTLTNSSNFITNGTNVAIGTTSDSMAALEIGSVAGPTWSASLRFTRLDTPSADTRIAVASDGLIFRNFDSTATKMFSFRDYNDTHIWDLLAGGRSLFNGATDDTQTSVQIGGTSSLITTGSTTVGTTLTVRGNTTLAAATSSAFAITGLANSLLYANANGSILATSSVSVNYLDGVLGIPHGGTGTSTGGVTNGVEYYNGTTLTNSSGFVYSGSNVGVGTTSPFANLAIEGGSNLSSQSANPYALAVYGVNGTSGKPGQGILLSAGNANTAVGTDGGDITLVGGNGSSLNGGNGGAISITAGNGLGGGVPGSVTINPGTGTGTGSVLLASTGGNVGIGTTSPFASLSVQGSLALTGALYDHSASAGTNGYVLQTTGSGVQWVATSTLGYSSLSSFSATAPLQYDNTTGTFSITQASSLGDGYLSSTDWNTFNNKVATTRVINTVYPLQGGGDLSADRTITLAFGTTTSNTWAGTQTFTNAPVFSALTNGFLAVDGSGTVSASTSLSVNYLTGTVPVAKGGTGSTTLSGVLVGNGTSAVNTLVLPSFLSLSGSTLSLGTLGIANGGTNNTTFTNNGVAYYSSSKLTNSANFTFTTGSNQLNIASNGWYSIGGNLLAYASSTNYTTIFGIGAGGKNATTSTGINANTAVGYHALSADTSGYENTATGYYALTSNTTGNFNTAYGASALYSSVTGYHNTAVGQGALYSLTSGTLNVAIGDSALPWYTTATDTVAVGDGAGSSFSATSDFGSVYLGANTGVSLTGTSLYNTFLGYQAGYNVTSGYGNILLGANTGGTSNLTSGSNNIGIGNDLQFANGTASNRLNIGDLIFGNLPATTTAFTLPTSGSLGIGTSSPYAKFSIALNNGDTTGTAFAIGSSTASATTTLFSVDNQGNAALAGNLTVSGSATTTNFGITGLANTLLYANANGSILATSSISTNYLTGTLGIAHGGTGTTTGGVTNGVEYYNGSTLTNSSALTWNGSTFGVNGFVNVDQYSGYQQAGNTILYASSTLHTLAVGTHASPNGSYSVSVGENARQNNSSAYDTAVGYGALTGGFSVTSTGNNTAVGYDALNGVTSGSQNVAIGANAGQNNQTGSNDVGIGYYAHYNSGSNNVAIGTQALYYATANDTLAIGYNAGEGSSFPTPTIEGGTYLGYQSGASLRTGADYNIALGYQSGYLLTSGADNILIGAKVNTGGDINSGSNNIGLAYNLVFPSSTASNQLNIGNTIFGTLVATSTSVSVPTNFTGTLLGIASTSPWARLSVDTANLGTSPAFAIGSSTATRFVVTNTGNVGIGTTSPFASLSVQGSLALTGALYDHSASAGTNGYVLQTTGSGVQWVATSTLGYSSLSSFSATAPLQYDNTTGTFSITQASSLGDGYLSSTDWNTFNNKVATTRVINTVYPLQGGGTLGSDLTLSLGTVGIANGGTGTTTGGVTNGVEYYNGSTLTNDAGLTYVSGNLGIGTTSPNGALTIGSGQLLLANGSTGAPSIAFGTEENTGFYRKSGGKIEITIGGTDEGYFSAAKFGSANASGYVLGTGASGTTSPTVLPNAKSLTTGIGGDQGSLSFIVGGTADEVITSAGNVGIGTTSPFATLSVAGNTYIGGNLTATGAVAFTGITNGLLSADAAGNITASTSIGVNYLTGTLGIANGGTGTSTGGVTNGVEYYNGSTLTNSANFTFTPGSNQLNIASNGGYYLGGNLLAYASSTNSDTIFGLNAGGKNATTSATAGYTTAIGAYALSANTTGGNNTAVGYKALFANTGGYNNVANGTNALAANITGYSNTAVGNSALYANTTGTFNVGIGESALVNEVNGRANIGIGSFSLDSVQSGYSNVAIGFYAMDQLLTGSTNVAIGDGALDSAAAATNTVAIGEAAGEGGQASDVGSVYLGANTGWNLTGNALYNTFLGYQAGYNVTSGYGNILLGADTGATSNLTTGSNNIGIGNDLQFSTSTVSNRLNIGDLIFGNLPATTTAFTLPTSGALGIGTSSPYAKFSIALNNGDTAGTAFAIGSSTASATTTLFSVLNSGNVGIGTTSPFATLSVAGNTYIGGNLTATGTVAFTGLGSGFVGSNAGTLYTFATSTLGFAPATSGSSLLAGDGSGGFTNVTPGLGLSYSAGNLTIATSSLYTGTTGEVPYFSGTNTLTATSSLYIATNGNIGIGSTSPASPLTVSAASTAAGQTLATFGTAGFGDSFLLQQFRNTPDGLQLKDQASGLNIIESVPSGGWVGLGSGNLGYANSGILTYNNSILVDPTSVDFGYGTSGNQNMLRLYLSGGTSSKTAPNPTFYFTTNTVASTTSNPKLVIGGQTITFDVSGFNGSYTQAATILANGNFGIGTTNPNYTLDVAGPINTDKYSGYYQDGNLLAYASTTNQDTIFGFQAGGQNATTSASIGSITAIGDQALTSLTTGIKDVAIGSAALYYNTTGSQNTAVGTGALLSSITGSYNTAIGRQALFNNTSATNTTAIGYGAGYGNGGAYTSQGGVYLGYQSGGSVSTASDYNTFLGYQSGYLNTTGYDNILLGAQPNTSGTGYLTTGGNNIGIGFNTLFPSATGNNQLNIGNLIFGTLPATTTASSLSLPTSGSIGIGTTSPFAKFSIQANAGDTATTLFAIGSSTASATTTLFSVSNTGQVNFGDSSGSGDANLQFGSDANAWTVGYNSTDKSFNIASSTDLGSNIALTISKGATTNFVGIGTTSPETNLTVVGAICAARAAGSQTVACGTTPGEIFANSSNLSGGYDLAETYPTNDLSLGAGSVISFDQNNPLGIARAAGPLAPFLGVISTQPGLTLGVQASTTRAVALAGRVPVTVSGENGPINIGDRLMLSSDQPGVAVKATHSGQTIGVALESWSGTGKGSITAFISPEYWFAPTDLSVNSTNGTVNIGTTSTSNDLVVNGNVTASSFEEQNARAALISQFGSLQLGSSSLAATLTADGTGVDLFKLTTFALSDVQALATETASLASTTSSLNGQVASLQQRVTALEAAAVAGLSNASSTNPTDALSATTTQIANALQSVGILIQNGIAQFNTLVVRNIVFSKDQSGSSAAGSGTILAGNTVVDITNDHMYASSQVSITPTSAITGNWYVTQKQDGSFRVELSQAQSTDFTFDYLIVQTSGQIATSTPTGYVGSPFTWLSSLFGNTPNTNNTPVTQPSQNPTPTSTGTSTPDTTASSTSSVTVTLNGAAAISLSVGDLFTDPGATATDASGTDITGSIQESGSVDTNTAGIYTLTYTATDAAGNTGSASRVVTVGGGPSVSSGGGSTSSSSGSTATTTTSTTTSTSSSGGSTGTTSGGTASSSGSGTSSGTSSSSGSTSGGSSTGATSTTSSTSGSSTSTNTASSSGSTGSSSSSSTSSSSAGSSSGTTSGSSSTTSSGTSSASSSSAGTGASTSGSSTAGSSAATSG